MKKLLLSALLFTAFNSNAQQGLENIIVETYYISDANDTTVNADGGILPVGSVTYRIYADMLPGYRFQAVYGIPGHEMRIETSTLFFNNEDRGATTPTYTKTHAKGNTVMLDSWLSVGAACVGNYGVLKANDDGVATVINDDNVLQSANVGAGIPLNVEDGLMIGTPEPVTIVGISTEIAMFDNQNDGTNGPVFATSNGSWASLLGSVGPDTVENKVLIAQITTDGTFCYKLNVQLGTPTLGVENYVADSAVANEIFFAGLKYGTCYPVGINESDVKSDFLLFPNPANDILKIKLFNQNAAQEISARIYNVNGSLVRTETINNSGLNQVLTTNVAELNPGLYIIEVAVDGVKSASKFIKH